MGKKVIYVGIVMLVIGILLGFLGTNTVIKGEVYKNITIPYKEAKVEEFEADNAQILYFEVNCTKGKVAINLTSPNGEVVNATTLNATEKWNYSVEKAIKGKYLLEIKNIGNSSSSVIYSAYEINSTGIYLMLVGMLLAVLSAVVMMVGVVFLYISKMKGRYGGELR